MALSPFISALSAAADFKARDLGLMIAPGAYVHMLANIAGFVGGDHVAALLASEIDVEKPVIIMDIGTNTEICLVQAGNITSVSCPSGPAFEGGNISAGMRAAEGAIELVRIKGDELTLKVIGDVAPVGLCGSGVLDVVAQLYLAGVCDNRGRLREEHSRVLDLQRHERAARLGHAGCRMRAGWPLDKRRIGTSVSHRSIIRHRYPPMHVSPAHMAGLSR